MTSRILLLPVTLAATVALVAPAASSTATPTTPTAQAAQARPGHPGPGHPGPGHPGTKPPKPPKPGADVPLVFGHRGASGYRPEHTLASYDLAIRLGADYIEPDLVSTRDGVLVARHENEISGTTDVAEHPELASRRTTKTIDGRQVTGWFTEDLTYAELRTLRAKERLPQVRPDNTRYDGRFQVPTFAEVLALAKEASARTGRTIGVAPETKHPTYFDSIGLSLEEPMLAELRRAGLGREKDTRKARVPVLIQSFETTNLRQLDRVTDLPLEQLLDATGGPFDLAARGTTYADLATARGLRDIASYADWVGPNKELVLPRDPATGATGLPSALVSDAHAAGLRVVVFTLRDENQFMATNFRRGTDPDAKGDIFAEVTAFLDAGVDAVFADFPDSAVFARDAWVAARTPRAG